MPEPPTLMTRLRARVAGEISTDTIAAYRAAGASAYGLLVEAEQERTVLATDDYWTVSASQQTFFLATWNAFVLQSIADAFIDADFAFDPGTVGFVPPVTAEQAMRFYAGVEQWLVRARQAQADPRYRLDLHVPAELPAWVEVEPCPEAHLHAMLTASGKLREHAELAVADLRKRAPQSRQSDLTKIKSLLAAAQTTADYAEQLHTQLHAGQSASQDLHERIERSIKDALGKAFLTGQLAAMPQIDQYVPESGSVPTQRLPGPGDRGFDPWCLTDPHTRAQWQRDRRAQAAVDALWKYDPHPDRTLEIQATIDAALARGDVDYATDANGRRLGNYFCCPWSAVYVAKRPIEIGGKRLRPLQQFTFDVSAEEIVEGGAFKRELLVADFSRTEDIDYCDPGADGRHE